MIRSVILMFVTIALFNSARAAEWEGIYEGAIGKLPIQALLLETETGAYSYGVKPYDLSLIMKTSNATVTFTEASTPQLRDEDIEGDRKNEVSGSWEVSFANGSAKGIWRSADGAKSLPISLRLLRPLSELGETYDAEDTYHAVWARNLSFPAAEKGKTLINPDLGEAKDPVFNSVYPRYLSHPDAAQLAKINTFLEQQHRDAVVRQRACVQGARRYQTEETDDSELSYQVEHTVTYASPTVLSIVESGSAFCGGAHPNNYSVSRTFDLTKQELLGTEPYAGDLGQWDRVFDIQQPERRKAFTDMLANRWNAAAAKPTADDEPECAESGLNGDAPVFDLHIVQQGLAVSRTDYPHVMSVCIWQSYNPTIIPWADLKSFARAEQTLLPELK